jgi:hypothetical protein
VENLHVDDELVATVIENEGTHAATTGLEGFTEAGPEVGLIDDGDGLLDIAGLSHGNNWLMLVKNSCEECEVTYRYHQQGRGHGIA